MFIADKHNNPNATISHMQPSIQTKSTISQQTQVWLDYLQTQNGLAQAIPNIQTTLMPIQIGEYLVPASLNDSQYNNSYVCSPYTAYISYAKDELGLLKNPWLQQAFKPLIFCAGLALKHAKINQTLSLNNWLMSTNVPGDWSAQALQTLTQQLTQTHPQHSLTIRSLNPKTHHPLMERLTAQNWLLIPARQVYLFDPDQTWWKKSHTKRDQAFLRKTPLQAVSPQEHQPEDFKAMAECFAKLFIEKHSHYNPQFSETYLHFCHQAGLVDFYSFRNQHGKIIATIGLWTQENIITTPIVGYDTTLPRELGLYRLLMARLLLETKNRGQMMNLSSGAGHFKRQRGGEASIEYTAFYIQHLPKSQQRWLRLFAKLMNRYAPSLLEKNQI